MPNTLLHSPALIIAKALTALNLGTEVPTDPMTPLSPWPVYAGKEPSAPDNVITVYTTVGTDDPREMFGTLHQHYGFQVRVRAAKAEDGEVKGYAIRRALAEDVTKSTVYVGSANTPYYIQCCARIGQLLDLGDDKPQTARRLFTLNAVATLRPL